MNRTQLIEAMLDLADAGRQRLQEAARERAELLESRLQREPSAAAYLEASRAFHAALKMGDAERILHEALVKFPDNLDVRIHLLDFLQLRNAVDEVRSFARECRRDFPEVTAFEFFENLTVPVFYRSENEIDEARGRFQEGLARQSRDIRLDTPTQKREARRAVGMHTHFHLSYQARNDRALNMEYGRLVQRIMAASYPEWSVQRRMPPLNDRGRIRVGYVSFRFCHDSVANTTIGTVENADHSQFEVFTYKVGPRVDYVTWQFQRNSDRFENLPAKLEPICHRILADDLHILVFADVGMDPLISEVAGLRLAPVQCATWGVPLTSGFPTIDFYLSGDLMEPADAQEHYSEQLIRLPNMQVAYPEPSLPERVLGREHFGLPSDRVVYNSCQSVYKYLPQHDFVFPQIARRVPNACFAFLEHEEPGITRDFRGRLDKAFAAEGLASREYCYFVRRQNHPRFLNLCLASDVMLDTFGWSGANTTFEAVAAGLPVVTYPGEFMRGRHSYAILNMIGVTETIAESFTEYVEIASRLGLDIEWRNHMRAAISAGRRRLFNDREAVRGQEEFYREVVRERLASRANS